MRTGGQDCPHHNAEKDYADDRGLIKPAEEASDKH